MKHPFCSRRASAGRFPRRYLALPLFLAFCFGVPAANNDTIVANGTERFLDDLMLENNSSGTFIIQAKNGATINANRLQLNSLGNRGGGAWIESSSLYASDMQINVSGNSGGGIYLANDSQGSLKAVNITAQNNALGLVLDGLWSMPQGLAKAEVSDSEISGAEGDAIRVMAGELTLNNVSASTDGSGSYALNANTAAAINVNGGSFTTQGEYSDAVWIASADSSVVIDNATLSTAGDRASALNAQKGTAVISNSLLETSGENAYGLYTENQIRGDGLKITTRGVSGAGMFTALGGEGSLAGSTVTTYGELAPGLLVYPGSKIIADKVQIETNGKESFGLWGRMGTLEVSNSQVIASGEAASGLYVNGYSSTLANKVSLDNVKLSSERAQAIEIATTDLDLEVKDSVISGGNGQLMTVSHYEDALDPANNLYSNLTFNAAGSTLNGDIEIADAGNNTILNLTAASQLNGAVNNLTALTLDASSRWNMSNSSSLGQLTHNGTIIFSDQNKFDTLTVSGDYAGDGGLLVFNSVLGDDASATNRLVIGGDVLPGTTRVAVNNLGGKGAQTIEGIEIVAAPREAL